ncbi:hypothetical protein [Parasporobacterium paucivorans]|nr:hypothetical protein [Parasporobacterium paucivorans]
MENFPIVVNACDYWEHTQVGYMNQNFEAGYHDTMNRLFGR